MFLAFSNPLIYTHCGNLLKPHRYVSTSQELLATSRDQCDTDVLDSCSGFNDGDVDYHHLHPLKLFHSDREKCTRQSAYGNTDALGTTDDDTDGESDDAAWLQALSELTVFPLSRARKLYPTRRYYTEQQWCVIPVDSALPAVGQKSAQSCCKSQRRGLRLQGGAKVGSCGPGAGTHRFEFQRTPQRTYRSSGNGFGEGYWRSERKTKADREHQHVRRRAVQAQYPTHPLDSRSHCSPSVTSREFKRALQTKFFLARSQRVFKERATGSARWLTKRVQEGITQKRLVQKQKRLHSGDDMATISSRFGIPTRTAPCAQA